MGLSPRRDRLADLLARATFPPPRTAVSCAVSGGADSLALLVLATEAGCEVTAVHVDHGLRAGSEAEAEVVRAAADRFGARFRSESVRVAPGPNLEARARDARYAVLPPDVLTGHTADDNVETVLINLLRGAGVAGLAGIRPERRPLLGLRRSETAALCHDLGLTPVDDPTNRDPRFLRNRVRHELLPLLDELAGRDVAPVLARQARHLRGVGDLLDVMAADLDPTDARALSGSDPTLASVAVRRWLGGRPGLPPPDTATVDRVLAVAGNDVRAADVGGGWRVARTAQRLRLEPPRPANTDEPARRRVQSPT